MTEDIFLKILNQTATDAEKVAFFKSIESDPQKREDYYRYKNLYVQSSLNPENYRNLQNENFSKFQEQVLSGKAQSAVRFWLRYAAVFIVASALGFMADYLLATKNPSSITQHIKYSSEKGSVSTIYLEDGSSIWLSSGTSLILNKNNQEETIAQLDGEAYFDLIPNPARKFVVDLGRLKVRDIGTKFNIRAYKSEQTISASLVEGKIDLFKESEKSFMSVKPGEYVKFDKADEKIAINQKDPSIITAWKDGKFVFIDQPLSEICVELENWYNAEIQIEDQKLATTRYTSVVKRSTTIEMVLKILSITDQIHYEIINKKEGKDIIKIRK